MIFTARNCSNKDIEHLFVSRDVAVQLQALGCDIVTLYYYWPDQNAPKGTKFGLVHKDNDQGDLTVEEGYKKGVFGSTGLTTPAYLYQQVIDWFRDKYKFNILVYRIEDDGDWYSEITSQLPCKKAHDSREKDGPDYYTVLNKAIIEAIRLIKK